MNEKQLKQYLEQEKKCMSTVAESTQQLFPQAYCEDMIKDIDQALSMLSSMNHHASWGHPNDKKPSPISILVYKYRAYQKTLNQLTKLAGSNSAKEKKYQEQILQCFNDIKKIFLFNKLRHTSLFQCLKEMKAQLVQQRQPQSQPYDENATYKANQQDERVTYCLAKFIAPSNDLDSYPKDFISDRKDQTLTKRMDNAMTNYCMAYQQLFAIMVDSDNQTTSADTVSLKKQIMEASQTLISLIKTQPVQSLISSSYVHMADHLRVVQSDVYVAKPKMSEENDHDDSISSTTKSADITESNEIIEDLIREFVDIQLSEERSSDDEHTANRIEFSDEAPPYSRVTK